MAVRIISKLGVGSKDKACPFYSKTSYVWNNKVSSPKEAYRLRTKLDKVCEQFSDLVGDSHSPIVSSSTKSAGFLNLSNHPISTWTAEQREQAEALGFGLPIDFPEGFPEVDPEATSEQVETMVASVLPSMLATGCSGAFVAGEFTLAFLLVARLQQAEVACYCSTTARRVTTFTRPDGTIEKRSEFSFVQWRRYPTLGQ
jgi:hypothetical protein